MSDGLAAAKTYDLLDEVRHRMLTRQNSTKGRELGQLCAEAMENLDRGILEARAAVGEDRTSRLETALRNLVDAVRDDMSPEVPWEQVEEAMDFLERAMTEARDALGGE